MSGIFSSVANYSGRQPDVMQNIKQFFTSAPGAVYWCYKTVTNTIYITPVDQNKTVLIPKDLFVVGSITNTSDQKLKENITTISRKEADAILQVCPKKYNFINDDEKKQHYGVIAQELELVYPELVDSIELDGSTKTVNYIELIPILICKIQQMQEEIDELQKNVVWK